MATWIGDGYDRVGELNGWRFLYRPLPQSQRFLLSKAMGDLFQPNGRRIGIFSLTQLCEDRIVSSIGQHALLPSDIFDKPETIEELWSIVSGHSEREELSKLRLNLISGSQIHFKHPYLSEINCDFCKKYWVDTVNEQPVTRDGKVLERDASSKPACQEPGLTCPVGCPEKPKRLNETNRMAMRRHYELKATGNFPQDFMFESNAAIIRQAEGSQ